MPTYQYACTECGHAFEQVQSFSDDALTVCPECEGRLRKVFNAVGVVFKGSGFYRTDTAAGSVATAAPAAKSETKSESKTRDEVRVHERVEAASSASRRRPPRPLAAPPTTGLPSRPRSTLPRAGAATPARS